MLIRYQGDEHDDEDAIPMKSRSETDEIHLNEDLIEQTNDTGDDVKIQTRTDDTSNKLDTKLVCIFSIA